SVEVATSVAAEAAHISVVASAFIALPLFAAAVTEDFATRSACGRPMDDRLICARKVTSQNRQSIPRRLHNSAVLFLPLAIARRRRRQHHVRSRLSQRRGPATMRGITSLHEEMGIGIAIGTAAAHIIGTDIGGPGTATTGSAWIP